MKNEFLVTIDLRKANRAGMAELIRKRSVLIRKLSDNHTYKELMEMFGIGYALIAKSITSVNNANKAKKVNKVQKVKKTNKKK
jgi:hypothetical protein